MATQVYEEAFDLSIGLVEATMPSIPLQGESLAAYPYPSLRPVGQEEVRTFAVAVLENDFLRVSIAPGLGGRVIGFFDKRGDVEILRRHPSVTPQIGGVRGAVVREGIQVRLGGLDRPNSLGPTAVSLVMPETDEDPGAVWIAETGAGQPISLHVRYELPSDRAELRFMVRTMNRSFESVAYDGGLAIYLGEGDLRGKTWFSPERSVGLTVTSEDLVDYELEEGIFVAQRFGRKRYLAGRQVDTWNAVLTPISGVPRVSGSGSEGSLSLSSEELLVQVTQEREGHTLFLLTKDGQTFEAPADLTPKNILKIPLGNLPSPAVAARLRDPQRQDVLSTESSSAGHDQLADDPEPERWEPWALSDGELRDASFDVAKRGVAFTQLGLSALARGDFDQADLFFENALAYNADDPLLWWAKAMGRRLAGIQQEERPELLNAHFLAPLEPALRAEAFLSQESNAEKDPSPLVRPLEETPEAFVEVAALFVEWGLYAEANRWIDESLRHGEQIMLHYLQAYCYLVGIRMDAQAAEHVAAAARLPLEPPFPWRRVEATVMQILGDRFPKDERIELIRKFVRSRNIS